MRYALFLSPHLDDVAFSCGGTLIELLRRGWDVALCTVFTASVPAPQGFALRCQTDKGIPPEIDYMALRRNEDHHFAAMVGRLRLAHWPFAEAPHRGYDSPEALFAGMHMGDTMWREIADTLRADAAAHPPDLVFAPQGLGNHVDHLHVIEAVFAADLAERTCWYRDTPYAIRQPKARPSARLPDHLPEYAFPIDGALEQKIKGCACYASQLGFQFGGAQAMPVSLSRFHQAEAARLGYGGWVETCFAPAQPPLALAGGKAEA